MSKVKAEVERQRLDGELSPEALAILEGLSGEEIETGVVVPADRARLPKGFSEERTPQRIKEVLADAALERTVGELLSRARQSSNLTLAEVGELLGVSKARVSQLERSDANLELKTLRRLANALGYDLVVALKPRAGGSEPLAAELRS